LLVKLRHPKSFGLDIPEKADLAIFLGIVQDPGNSRRASRILSVNNLEGPGLSAFSPRSLLRVLAISPPLPGEPNLQEQSAVDN
jgi:hypothetical protein